MIAHKRMAIPPLVRRSFLASLPAKTAQPAASSGMSPNNAIRLLKNGGFGSSTQERPQPYGMPAYAHQLSAREAAAVLSYIRTAWGNTASAVAPHDLLRE